jgi:hypothetical protein
VRERGHLDLAEKAKLDRIAEEMWANLPPEYQWVKAREWV